MNKNTWTVAAVVRSLDFLDSVFGLNRGIRRTLLTFVRTRKRGARGRREGAGMKERGLTPMFVILVEADFQRIDHFEIVKSRAH